MKILALGTLAAVLLGAWNWFAYQALQSPAAAVMEQAVNAHAARNPNATGASDDSAVALPWSMLEKITLQKTPTGNAEIPAELSALNGKFVHIAGVFSPLEQLASGKTYLGGVLQPPSKLSCCGITCDPRTQLLVFIDCSSAPWTQGKERRLVSVIGRLEVSADNNAWGNASLGDVRIESLQAR